MNNQYQITHGDSKSKLYKVHTAIKQRCLNSRCDAFPYYGGRGIEICKEWLDYPNFKEWATQNGYKQGLTIERINNDKGYNATNCKWATQQEQSKNTRLLNTMNVSGFRGVSYIKNTKRKKKWIADVKYNGKAKRVGYFDYPWTASMARDSYVLNNNMSLPLNFKKRV